MLGAGLVNSLAQPNGNTTGLSILATELDGKRQELLIEAVPGLRRMAVLADSNRTAAVKLDALQQAAHARNIQLSIHPSRREARRSRLPSTWHTHRVLQRSTFWRHRSFRPIAKLLWIESQHCACRPCINGPKWRRKAALPPTDHASMELCRESLARQLVQLLQGTKVADMPVEQPTKFELGDQPQDR